MRPISKVAPEWWDYTTLDRAILDDAARLTADDLLSLSRPGFTVKFYDTIEDFYLAEALEYITSWRQATPEQPAGICGPIGPTEQLPLVARLVNELEIDLRYAHFWGMDEWVVDGKEAGIDFPLSFAKADMELCFNRIRPELRMPLENIHFPAADPTEFIASCSKARCVVMQGGQGEVKHWAFNDPPKRQPPYQDNPPPPEVVVKLQTAPAVVP
jgi:glucosamine-6-phosphate deaminase